MSFLDWREQTYPSWVESDLAYIADSKSLSTNIAHFACLSLAASLAKQRHEPQLSNKYREVGSISGKKATPNHDFVKLVDAGWYVNVCDTSGQILYVRR